MVEQTLSKVQGDVIAFGPRKELPQRTHYDYIRLRISDSRETTIRNVSAAPPVNQYLAPDKTVTLYFIESPSGEKCLFAIDAGGQRADDIDAIGRDQARARKKAIKWVILSIPLCLVLVGLALLPASIYGLIMIARAPKPEQMRAFLAPRHAAELETAAARGA
jgi:hypothetical protein